MQKFIIIIIALISSLMSYAEENISAPDFEGRTINAGMVKLSDYKGKVVLLDFWASWCGPCRKEFPFLIELHDKYKGQDFVIIAVNVDKEDNKCSKFIEKLDKTVPFDIIRDSESLIPPKYNIESMPTTLMIDKSGIIRYKHTGFTDSKKDEYIRQIDELLKQGK